MSVRLIALDIDGTLLDSRWQLPEANRVAIAEATKRGIEVALVTGRRYDFALPIARQIGVPIKALIGAQLLRHTHATIDRRGDQFVVRKNEPAAPPDATRVPLWYVRGGGMLVRASVTPQSPEKSVLLVDTSSMFPIALEDALWKKAGVDLAKLTPAAGAQNVKEGVIPMVKFAGFDLPQIPGVEGRRCPTSRRRSTRIWVACSARGSSRSSA